MQQETKQCQNCKQQFVIEPQDFAFYQKMQVPPPTFCPECRLQRRLAWRNERTLYARTCDLCKKQIIGMYPAQAPFPVYCNECWWSDKWNSLDFGKDYDFSKPFFEQFSELAKTLPRFPLFKKQTKNSEYTNVIVESVNCYLTFACIKSEDCAYGKTVWECRNVFDALYCYKCEQCYEIIDCNGCYNLRFSRDCVNCRDSSYLLDCSNCRDCFGCVGLKNKQYCFNNEQCTKEEYEKKVAEWKKKSFTNFVNFPRRFAMLLKSAHSTGNHMTDCNDCITCFDIKDSEDSKYIFTSAKSKDSYDCSYMGLPAELAYEAVTSYSYNIRFSINNFDNLTISYCTDCYTSENMFGCIGISKGRYCILNKQYSKDEYEALVPKIIQHMKDIPYTDKAGRTYGYGEFFPVQLSPFAYNETVAQEFFPLTREQALSQGHSWKEPEKRNVVATISSEKLADDATKIDDSILKQVIACQHEGRCNEQCTGAFRIIPPELDFYRKMKLSLPRLCPNCRHYERLAQRNPLKLWQRQCQCARKTDNKQLTTNNYRNTTTHFHTDKPCPNTFETSYSPERPEIVYCEHCYLSEVV